MLEDCDVINSSIDVLPNGSETINAKDFISTAAFSTMLVSNNPICVERTVYWSNGIETVGGFSSPGTTSKSTSWYFPNGSTGDNHHTYLLLQNPNNSVAIVDVVYTLDDKRVITRVHELPAHSRYTIYTNNSGQVGNDQDFSIKVLSNLPIIAEKTIYFLNEGYNTFGSTSPASKLVFTGRHHDK
jgi:hypothetical protein